MLWAKTRMCFRGKGEGWLTQWVVLVLVNTPLPRTEGYVCMLRLERWQVSIIQPYTSSTGPHKEVFYVFKKKHRCVPIQTGVPFCPILPIKAAPSSPSFQEQLRKSSLSLESSKCLHALSPSFNFQSTCLSHGGFNKHYGQLQNVFSFYQGVSWIRGRSVPWYPDSHQRRKRGAHSTIFTRIFNKKFNKYFVSK